MQIKNRNTSKCKIMTFKLDTYLGMRRVKKPCLDIF